eukprot:scaffold64178_cov22-Tisochrysis_lutea.AAC.1
MHPGIQYISDSVILTSSADKTARIWSQQQEQQAWNCAAVLKDHQAGVRVCACCISDELWGELCRGREVKDIWIWLTGELGSESSMQRGIARWCLRRTTTQVRATGQKVLTQFVIGSPSA